MRTTPYVLIGGFLTGVLWRSFFDIGFAGAVAILVAALALLALTVQRKFYMFGYVLLALLACLLGAVRTEFASQEYEQHRVFENDTPLVAQGIVVSEPDIRESHTVLYIELDDTPAREATLRIRAKVPLYPTYAYGDRVAVEGTLRVPRAFETDTGRTFDYAGYLMKDGIHYELRDVAMRKLENDAGNPIVAHLLALKHSWLVAVSRLLPEPGASLAGGVVVGAKRSLGEDWLNAFRVTGIIHIVVLSGYNLTLIANSIVRATRFLPRAAGFVLGVLGIISFALMTGASSTVVRASVMAVLGMLAAFSTRPYTVLRALAIAAFCMVLWNPFVLAFDPGFQLSFMATVGLILGSPLIEKRLSFLPEGFGFRGIVAATLATQLLVLPLLMYQIGGVSLVAPIVNVLILPIVPLLMALGFAAGLIGMVSTLFALPLAWCAYLLLEYSFMVVDLFAQVPYGHVVLPSLSPWAVLLMYGALLYLYLHVTKTTRLMSSGTARTEAIVTRESRRSVRQ